MSDEMKKYMGVLMEDTNEKFKLLGEGISLNYDLLKKLTDDVAVLKTNVSEFKTKANVIQQDIKEIKEDIKEKDSHIHMLDNRVSELELS